MRTVLVEINNNKVFRLLKLLEGLHLIRLFDTSSKPQTIEKLSDKFGGKLNLTDKEYKDFQQHMSKSRGEWDKNI